VRRLILVVPLCLLFIAVALSVDGSFYVSLLERGKVHFAEGAYELAAKELRIAAFGLLDDIPKYETAHLLLALAHQRLGHTDLAALSVRKLYDAERVMRAYPTLPIDTAARRSFEQLAASVLTREEFALLIRPTAPAQEATTPSTTTSRIEPPDPSTAEADRIAAERREQERIVAQRSQQERIAAQRREEERIAAQRREEERIATQRREEERIVAQRSEEEGIAAQRRDEERAAALRQESERIAAERIAAERREKERMAVQRRDEEQASTQRRENERVAAQRREEERLAAERQEEQRASVQRREEEERASVQRREEEQRAVAERQEQEQAAAQRREADRVQAQRAEAEQLDRQRREEAARAAVPATQQPVRVQVRPTAQRATLSAEIRRQLDTADRAVEQGNLEQARNIYVRLLNSGNTPRAAMLEVARGLYQTADFRGAVAAFSRIGVLRAGEEDFHYYAAVSLFETGNFAAAYKQLLCALPFIRVTDDVARYRAKIEGMIN
jgi:hypothetical protein